MMNNKQISILAVECSSKICSVSIGIDGRTIAEYNILRDNSHDKELAELTKKIVADCGLSFDEISAIAISAGPGSFTGLRIGAGFAKGLCFDGASKLIAIPTILALVRSLKDKQNISSYNEIIGLVHSHKDMFYFQRFNANFELLSDATLLSESEIIANIGEGALIVSNEKVDFLNNVNYQIVELKAGNMISLAFEMYNDEKFEDSDSFTPFYCQDFSVKTHKTL